MSLERPYRVVIVGTSGTGKSTLARKISNALSIPDIELDDLFWKPNWEQTPMPEFVATAKSVIAARPEWVVHGNYSQLRDWLWNEANTLIWLDYSFPVTFTRSLRRTLRRLITREAVWSSRNVESFRQTFFSRKSILLWVFQTWGKRRRDYPSLLERPEYSHLRKLRFREPREAEAFLRGLSSR